MKLIPHLRHLSELQPGRAGFAPFATGRTRHVGHRPHLLSNTVRGSSSHMGDSHAVVSQHVKSNRENSEHSQNPCNPEMMSGLTLRRRAAAPFFSCERAAPGGNDANRFVAQRESTVPDRDVVESHHSGGPPRSQSSPFLDNSQGGRDDRCSFQSRLKWGSQSMLTLRDSLRSMKPTEREPSKILDRVDSLIDELLNDSDLSSSSLASILMAARESVAMVTTSWSPGEPGMPTMT